jgi:hypothetical protein
MAAQVVAYTLFQMIRAAVADRAVVVALMVPWLLVDRHPHLVKVLLAAAVSVLSPGMPEFPEVVVVQVPQVPMAATLSHNLATVELAFCGSMVTITLVAVVAEIGQQLSVPAMVDWAVVVVVVRRAPGVALLVQPAPAEVLRLIAAQLVQEILLVQAILPVELVEQIPVAAVVVQVKVNINHIQEMVVLAVLVL